MTSVTWRNYTEPDYEEEPCRHLFDPDTCPLCEEEGPDCDVDEETWKADRAAAEHDAFDGHYD